MIRSLRVATSLLVLGCALAVATRAAVMTGNIKVSSGAPPYQISYILAQDVTSMSVTIKKVSDNSVVKTFSVLNNAAWTMGPHTTDVEWDGTTTGGSAAPAGDYYAEITTAGAARTTFDLLWSPLQVADATGVQFDGRSQYSPMVNTVQSSPYKNLSFLACAATNAAARTGIAVTNPDASPNTFLTALPTAANDYTFVSILDDGTLVATGATSGNVTVMPPDGTNPVTMGAGRITTRGSQAFGTAAHPELFFVGNGGTLNGLDVNYYPDLSAVTATSTPLKLALSSAMPTASRSLVVNKARTSFWVGNAPGTANTTGWAQKWNITRDGSNNVTGATLDSAFVFEFAPGVTYPTGANNRGMALSPDESILWEAFNEGSAAFPNDNSIIFGVDANTGAYKGDNYKFLAPDFNCSGIGVAAGGNIYVTTYPGSVTGTTANAVGVVAPPDNGSSDTTRSFPFSITTDTTIDITAGPTVNPITYHGGKVNWTTDVLSDSTVRWGYNAGALDQVVTDTNLTKNHSLEITEADQNLTVYYQVESNNTGFTGATSTERNFKTNVLTITAPQAAVTATTATITWTSSEASNSVVRWGNVSGTLDRTVTDNTMVTDHAVTLTGLTPLSTYFYMVESGWTGPVTPTVSNEFNFTTKAELKLVSEALAATTTTADLSFETNVAATAVAKWGAAPDALSNAINVASGTAHTANITGLSAGTTYYYSLELTATDGGTLVTPVSVFTTEFGGGADATVTHSTPDDIRASLRVNLETGAAGNLVKLERQGLPGAPVLGPDLPEERYYQAVVAYGGYLYVIGGRMNADSGNTRDTVFVSKINADGSLTPWTTTTPLPAAHMAMGDMCIGYNGHVYVVCGADAAFGSLNTVLYAKQNADGTLGAWATTTPLPLPDGRDLGSVAVVDGYLVLSGGEDNSVGYTDAQYRSQIQADGTVGPWVQVTSLPTVRWMNRTAYYNHTLINYGGYNAQVIANQAQTAGVMPNGTLTSYAVSPNNMPDNQNYFSFADGLAGGKLMSAMGRYGANTPINDITYTKLMPDGTTSAWTKSGNTTFDAACDQDGDTYNGKFYAVGGRTVFAGGAAAAAVKTVNIIPMEPDTADPDGATYVYAGSLDSAAIDLGQNSNLKTLTVAGSGLTPANCEVRYRFAGPNAMFTDWLTLPGTTGTISGGARWIQYQITLRGDGSATPTVNSVIVATKANAGVITVEDVKRALSIAGGLATASAADKAKLDVTGDGAITILDALKLNRGINGK